jgi:hypothetical protein
MYEARTVDRRELLFLDDHFVVDLEMLAQGAEGGFARKAVQMLGEQGE